MNQTQLTNSKWKWSAVLMTFLLTTTALLVAACRSGGCCGGANPTAGHMDHERMNQPPSTNNPTAR